MTKRQMLELLKDLVQKSERTEYESGDESGCNPISTIDSERLLANIEKELEECSEPDCICGHPHEAHTAISEDTGILHACKNCECQEYRSL